MKLLTCVNKVFRQNNHSLDLGAVILIKKKYCG